MLTDPDERVAALAAALVELERTCSDAGWDAPPRLFALVPTADVIADEPALAEEFGLRGDGPPGAWTAIEQGDFRPGDDLVGALQRLSWPAEVKGCALALERSFLPAGAEAELPDEPAAAQRVVAEHPDRQDIRLVVGVTRDGTGYGVGRLVAQPDELLGGPDLAPGLVSLLATTLA
ncbi:PPA1309 family protein [Naumannella huperziae]